jgi:hypothetical protein
MAGNERRGLTAGPDLPAAGRRDFLKSLGGLAAASLLGAPFSCRRAGDVPGKPPNLVYIFADQLRAQSVG